MIAAALLPLLWIASLQDPVPVPQDPVPEIPAVPQDPQDPTVPETETPSDPDAELMEEIQALVEKVRDGFRQVDVALKEVQNTADADAPSDALPPSDALSPAEVFDGEIGTAIDKADVLTADIEELLAKLPESDNSSQSSSSSQRPQQQRPQDRRPQDQNDPNRPDGMQEMPDGAAPPPDAPTIRLFFDARYGAWGTLPERLQATLENATTEDLPLRYRRWLDAYHRRSLEPRR